jgi:hypothetical protein
MPHYYDAECLRCGIPLGNFATKKRADEAMRQHERIYHGATGKISFKSKPDPSFKKPRRNSIFDMLNL